MKKNTELTIEKIAEALNSSYKKWGEWKDNDIRALCHAAGMDADCEKLLSVNMYALSDDEASDFDDELVSLVMRAAEKLGVEIY